MICDDDEEEWNCGDIETPSKKAKASKVSDDESEASFEASDSDESVSDLCDSSDDDDYKRTPKKAKVSSAPKSPSTTKISTSNDTPSSKMKPSAFVTPTKSPSLFSTPGSNNSKSSIGNTPDKDSETPASGVRLNGTHEHHKWPFMQPNTIKDIDGHRPDHPDYNPRTMSMPRSFLESQTPGMRQWCEFKMRNMDTVLFFKVGKFYELFHMDADVGFEELDLIYMKGDKAHSGFPEISYGKYATMLISKGFRVARVEQTETPEMLKERNDSASKGKKKDKVVLREMCSIMSRGTRTYSHLDDLSLLNESVSELSNESSAFDMPKESILMCITEIKLETNTEIVNIDNIRTEDEDDIGGYGERAPVVGYGVCCIDTVLGDVTFAQFHDDEQRNRLRTMLAQYFPSEIILEHGRFSDETMGAIKLIVPGVAFEYLRAKEIPTVKSTLSMLTAGEYFPESVPGSSIYSTYPLILQEIIEGLSGEEQNESFSSDLMFKAFGGVLWLLKKCLIDLQLISYGKCHGYVPPDETKLASGIGCSATAADTGADSSTSLLVSFIRSDMDLDAESELMSAVNADTDTVATDTTACVTATSTTPSTPPAPIVKHMTLDAVALSNLEILVNNYDKTSKGSLWEFINHTKTAFGRRLLHNWLCKPLYNVHEIKMRTLAVNDLLTDLSIEAGKCSGFLKGLPDLERLLSRIHCNGNKKRSVEHPDSRAVYYEAPLYNSRKIKDFAGMFCLFYDVC